MVKYCSCLEDLIYGLIPPKICIHLEKTHCLKLFCCDCIEEACNELLVEFPISDFFESINIETLN